MRIWSIHPKYLDTKGLVALWRETLLAKHVLEEEQKGIAIILSLTVSNKQTDPLKELTNTWLPFIAKHLQGILISTRKRLMGILNPPR